MAYDGSIIIDTSLDSKGFEQGLSRMNSIATKGLKVTGTAIGGLGAMAIKAGGEFESSFAKASTLFGDVAVDTENLQSKMLGLSKDTGIAASAIGNSLYNALSAGIPVTKDMGKATQYLTDCSKMAAAGFTDVDTVVTATAKVLNAYKMDVGKTADVHKILMQVQNKGITTVGELGAVLSQVTPTAAAMSVSFEQVGAALATMTAQGIPTAQATTMLNSLFAELGKQGQQAQQNLAKATEGTKYAGMSFAEMAKQGVPLNEMLGMMDTYAQQSGKALIDMFGSIEAGKAALSMSGQNAGQFASNLQAMATQADVVGDAYGKVTDTLEHKSEVLKNSFKTTGIQIYEYLKEPLKEAAESGIEALSSLSNSLDSGALGDSVKNIGKSFAGLAKSTADFAAKGLPKVINGLAWVMDNGKSIATTLIAMKAAMLGFKGAAKLNDVVASFKGVSNSLRAYEYAQASAMASGLKNTMAITSQQAAVGMLTGKVGIATGATTLLKGAMAALGGPVGIATIAISALTAGLGFLAATYPKQVSETDKLIEKIEEEHAAWQELQESRAEQMVESVGEIDHTKALWSELQNLADTTGHVTDANRTRASFIVGELNSALGTELSLTGNQIQGYQDQVGAIDALIEKKRALVLLEIEEAAYKEALSKLGEEENQQRQLAIDLAKQEEELAIARANAEELGVGKAGIAANARINALEDELEKTRALYQENDAEVNGYYKDIVDHENHAIGVQENNADVIEEINRSVSGSFQTAADGSIDALKQQCVAAEFQYQILKAKVASGNKSITEAQIQEARDMAEATKAEYVKMGGYLPEGMAEGAKERGFVLTGALQGLADTAVKAAKAALGIKSPSRVMKEQVGKQIALGVAKGIDENKNEAVKAAVKMAKETFEASKEFIDKQKYFNKMSLSDELLAWQRVQSQYIEGSEQRIEAEKQVYRAKKEIIDQMTALEDKYAKAVEDRAKQIRNSYGLFDKPEEEQKNITGVGLLENLQAQDKALKSWREDLAELARRGIDEGLLAELEAMGPKASAEIGALLELDPEQTQEYIRVWQSINEQAKAQAEAQAEGELTGLREETDNQIAELLKGVEDQFKPADDIGAKLTDGLANGISGGMSKVINAAIAVAQAAIRAVREELDIHSPSKKFVEIGLQSDAGWAKGLQAGIAQIRQASAQVAAASLPSAVVAGNVLAGGQTTVTNNKTIVREKVVGVRFEGSGADVARMLRPKLIQEERIVGKSFLPED